MLMAMNAVTTIPRHIDTNISSPSCPVVGCGTELS
jgi:tetrahydrodipicolinate N-succinyltransferase